jgi:hypothetical protein
MDRNTFIPTWRGEQACRAERRQHRWIPSERKNYFARWLRPAMINFSLRSSAFEKELK